MIYTLTDSICLDVSVLSVFLTFGHSDFINICKSNVDKTSYPNLALYQHQISSSDLPQRKRPSFRNHA